MQHRQREENTERVGGSLFDLFIFEVGQTNG